MTLFSVWFSSSSWSAWYNPGFSVLFPMFLLLYAASSKMLLICPTYMHGYRSYICLRFSRSGLYIQPCISATAVLFPSDKRFLCWHRIYQRVPFLSHTPLGACAASSVSQLPFESLLGDLGARKRWSGSTCPLLPSLETLKAGPPRVMWMCVLHRHKIRLH